MANWYTTEFCITGSQADRDAMMALLKDLYDDKDHIVALSDLADALGCDPEKTFTRGHIADFKEREDHIELYTESANEIPYQIAYALCRKFPSLKYYFQVDKGDEILTNDAEGRFYGNAVNVYLEHEGKELCGEFSDYNEALDWANEVFGTNWDDADLLSNWASVSGEGSYCQFVFTRVIGPDEQLTIIPRHEDGALDLYALDGTHAGTINYTIGKD